MTKLEECNADTAKEFSDKLFRENQFGKKTTNLSTSQIRKFLSAVNVLENKIISQGDTLSSETVNEIKFLKVKLAYQVGRNNGNKDLHTFYDELAPLIDEVCEDNKKDKKSFTQFARYLEAVVAYHKFNGGD